jgi:peptide/nickel transport system ATP-binding protein
MLAPSGSAPPAVAIRDVTLHYFTPDRETLALSSVSLEVERGEFIAVVGSSGCGKSTLLSIVSGLLAPSGGDIFIEGRKITAPSPQVGYMFQKDTLLEWRTVLDNVLIGAELLDLDMGIARRRAQELLRRYGLGEFMHSLPHQLSGGMRQRAMIAMALSNDPSLLIADEPTTALDVTVQAQILDLMRDLQAEFGSAIIMITHDLGVVAEMADEILVMYGGKAVEHGTVDQVFYTPEHPYAWGLLTSMPRLDRVRKERLDPIPGNPPSLINVPSGCAFHPRCGYRSEVPGDDCKTKVPGLDDAGGEHLVRCHIPPPRRRELYETDVKPRL